MLEVHDPFLEEVGATEAGDGAQLGPQFGEDLLGKPGRFEFVAERNPGALLVSSVLKFALLDQALVPRIRLFLATIATIIIAQEFAALQLFVFVEF